MGNLTMLERVKEAIAGITWKVFLWAINMTAEEYWRLCYKSERNRMCINSDIPSKSYELDDKQKKEVEKRMRKRLSDISLKEVLNQHIGKGDTIELNYKVKIK